MNKILIYLTMLISFGVYAEAAKNEWQNTSLSEETIKKIQQAQLDYKNCVALEMQKPVYRDIDTRKATDQVIKSCEPVLAKMREVFLAEKIPGAAADHHLKRLRIKTTRTSLREFMFAEAARKSSQQ